MAKKIIPTIGTLKLSWGAGKERNYGNEKDYEDKELTDYTISKLKWQRVTGNWVCQICNTYMQKIYTHTLKF